MWPPVVAVDAGPMQIQLCEGAVLSRAETVLQGTTHDTVRAEIGYGEKVLRRLWSKKLEEGIDLTASYKDTERPEGRRISEAPSVSTAPPLTSTPLAGSILSGSRLQYIH